MERSSDVAAPVQNSSKAADGPVLTAAKTASVSMNDSEMKKLTEACKRLQAEMDKLAGENRQLKVRPLRVLSAVETAGGRRCAVSCTQ